VPLYVAAASGAHVAAVLESATETSAAAAAAAVAAAAAAAAATAAAAIAGTTGGVGVYSRIQLRPASNYGEVPRRLMEEGV